ncbi:MAG: DUF1415 domain-containing protein [Bacteroidetes bacterium]|nr:DUF1415 domain-containing protein [Bacteroidota bacterium]
MQQSPQIIEQTKKWIMDVVIGCNFCPFAAREMKMNSVRYHVEESLELNVCLESFINECLVLDNNEKVETSFLIFSNAFKQFDDYLDLVSYAEKLLKEHGYTGVYQVASFHPEYLFANTKENDAANYTNRSIYPMLHLLREARIEQALANYPHAEKIPERNINFAREKGEAYMKMLRESCVVD